MKKTWASILVSLFAQDAASTLKKKIGDLLAINENPMTRTHEHQQTLDIDSAQHYL